MSSAKQVKLTEQEGGLSFNAKVLTNTAGIYVISIDNIDGMPMKDRSGSRKKVFKIGMSNNMVHRMRGYHTCFRDGYMIHALMLIVNYDQGFSKISDTKKGKINKVVRDMERETHRLLKQYQTGVASTTSEWFEVPWTIRYRTPINMVLAHLRTAYNKFKGATIMRNRRLTVDGMSSPTLIGDVLNTRYDRLPRQSNRLTQTRFEIQRVTSHDFSRNKIKIKWKGYTGQIWENMDKYVTYSAWKQYKKRNQLI